MISRCASHFFFLTLLLAFAFSIAGRSTLGQAPQAPEHVAVFKKGDHGYHTYRIPAITLTQEGTLLAFCEARKDSRGDAGNIDMVVSRSNDMGATWSKPEVIWDDGSHTCGNASPVVDQSTGTIWLLLTWNDGDDHESQILKATSKYPRHVYVTHSTDDGKTWAEPARISKTTRQDHWRWYATGPGNAIQLTRGKHAGRLLIPANHSDHSDASKHSYRSHAIFSDDHGKSWQLGGVHDEKTNESAVAELSDGSVLQAMRSYHGQNKRALSISRDGGTSWEQDYLDPTLDTPVCQASLIRYSWAEDQELGGKSRLLFSSPKGKKRSDMHVWVSYDEGKSWPIAKQIYAGGSAYSNLVKLPDAEVGLLYEQDGYAKITFAKFDLSWLER